MAPVNPQFNPYDYSESTMKDTYWSTSVRAEEEWQDELEAQVNLKRGTWVAVRYTGEYVTARQSRSCRKGSTRGVGAANQNLYIYITIWKAT